MNIRNKLILIGLAASAAALQPAVAQNAAATFTAGAKISDTAGGEVGTITSVDGDYVIVKTDKHEVRLPKTSFTAHEGGFLMGMTRDQLNAAVEQSLAAAAAKIVVGATVSGAQGAPVGTIDALDDQFATIKLGSGKLARLPRNALAAGPNGVVIGMTVAELEAAVGASTDGGSAEAPAQ
jgi:preprotein translocase subunit YajC